jgi:hypothetical protein
MRVPTWRYLATTSYLGTTKEGGPADTSGLECLLDDGDCQPRFDYITTSEIIKAEITMFGPGVKG